MSNMDKLLISLALILLITIVWTILFSIVYKVNESKSKKKKYDYDDFEEDDKEIIVEKDFSKKKIYDYDDEDEIERVAVKEKKSNEEKKTIKETPKEEKNAGRETVVVKKKKRKDLETYVKVRLNNSVKNLTYIVPDDLELEEGQKIKLIIDGQERKAIVVRGNYTRRKYRNSDYEELKIVK